MSGLCWGCEKGKKNCYTMGINVHEFKIRQKKTSIKNFLPRRTEKIAILKEKINLDLKNKNAKPSKIANTLKPKSKEEDILLDLEKDITYQNKTFISQNIPQENRTNISNEKFKKIKNKKVTEKIEDLLLILRDLYKNSSVKIEAINKTKSTSIEEKNSGTNLTNSIASEIDLFNISKNSSKPATTGLLLDKSKEVFTKRIFEIKDDLVDLQIKKNETEHDKSIKVFLRTNSEPPFSGE